MLGHELRNPLAAIQVAVDRLLRRGAQADPELHRVSALLQRQTAQLIRMVDDLLEVARVSSGKMALKKERTYLLSVVNNAVETTRPIIESKDQRLSVVMPPEQIALEVDPARLAQALVNLLNNAAKYTPAGGNISLSAERTNGEVIFRVKDSGIGIAPEMVEPIFELFVQSDRALDRSQGGLGLGLPLVRKIVELHHGTVAAFSKGPGQGSEFVIRIPVGSGTKSQEAHARPQAVAPATKRRVLVVDDNLDLVEGLIDALTDAGHEVRSAQDGPSAIETAREFKPEVVLLDIGLPLLDGYQVARRLRQLPGLENIRLIALSGYGGPKDQQLSAEAGFDLHLVKPAGLDRIEDLVAGPAPAG
jgi:two-component system CheB/CheR fusion protein